MKIEVSNGDVVDKMSILRIKESRIDDSKKLINIKREIEELLPSLEEVGIAENSPIYLNLLRVNETLWNAEDEIREKERLELFDNEFITIARSIYRLNDQRCTLKKRINIDTESNLIEEKSYTGMELQ